MNDDSGLAPRLTVIVPATNDPPTLSRCLAALRSSRRSEDEVLVITEPPGAGPAAARNAGAERASGDVLVFVDADVVVHRDALDRVRTAFASDRELTALLGSYDDAPAAPGVVSRFRNLLHHHVHHEGAGATATFWAGLGAVRRDTFLAVGGFDVSRFPRPAIEDVELGMRLSSSGSRIVLDPLVQGTHLKQWTITEMIRTDFADRGVPWVALLLRRRTLSTELNLGWRHRLGALAALAGTLSLVRGRPRGTLVAAATLVAVNRAFYVLLLRRLGPAGAAAGIGLHMLHHLVALAAVPAGLVAHLRESRAERGSGPVG